MSEPRKQVLCVDDDSDVTYVLKRYIERRFPIDVWIADNGYTALGMLCAHAFDAVLLDIGMPGINGLDVAAEIIKRYPKTIVIIITGSRELESVARAKGTRFLLKPVTLDTIRMLIYQHFGFIAN